jgi:4-hydroxy-3-methylbut-2-enyl diphosphate reductase
VRHEVVHNRFVVDDLKAKGAIFVEDLGDVPAGATSRASSSSASLRAWVALRRRTASRVWAVRACGP